VGTPFYFAVGGFTTMSPGFPDSGESAILFSQFS
jgi:hypothetical protein